MTTSISHPQKTVQFHRRFKTVTNAKLQNVKMVPLKAICGGLKENGPQGEGTNRRCGLVGVGVVFWRKYVTVRVGFEVSYMLKPCTVIQTTSCCL